jgi:putative CocE/NonD family hydrolase
VSPRVREELPRAVRTIENEWIELSDGARLGARIWLPEDAERVPVPAILEYIPYRKRDFMRARDEPMHHYLAGHGYACVRVDLRGSGDSDGLLLDEYLPQEQLDAVELIAWIVRQPWCTGSVGMTGISWGGFNALQVAAMRPPGLDAIITLCSTDDRYADDAHYMGGCLLNENLIWGSVLLTFNALPPDPEVAGERWRDLWTERLEHSVLFPELWMRHARRDAYWRQGSVCEDYSAIACPVYAVGGWADGYTNAIPRLLAGLEVPRKGLIGPWAHAFPHNALPGPAIGFLQDSLRWWDHWLKGADTGVMDEPMLRVWMQDSVEPAPFHAERPGRWVAEREWPSPRITPRTLYPTAATTLVTEPPRAGRLEVRSPQSTGLGGGDWCGFGVEGEAPSDQRADDGKSLVFDSKPLGEPLEILGAPVVELEVVSDVSHAVVAVRLNDVAAGGASLRVSYGLLNLAHRDGHERPEALEPGRRYRVRIALNDVAHRFPAGHSVRLAVSTCYWPIAWPAPEPATLGVLLGQSRLDLPVRPAAEWDDALAPFEPPEAAAEPEQTALAPSRLVRTIERDLTTNETIYTLRGDGGDYEGASITRLHDIGLDIGHTMSRRFCIGDADPLTARAEVVQRARLHRPGWRVRIETRTALSATRDAFLLNGALEAFENDESVFTREWDTSVPRDHL